jgi:hypothetical protein
VLVAAAVCPHPPLLVPELGVGLGAEIDDLRHECTRVVDAVCATAVDQLFVIGAAVGAKARSFSPWAPGSGVDDVIVDVPEALPLPLLVGAHLTRGRARSFVVVDPSTDAADCADLGRELAASADRVAFLVMGDGSARHDVKAPGYVDARAAEWDRTVHDAFRAADFQAVASLDPALADELMCLGRAPWQVLAGAATGIDLATAHASLSVPFGVGYFVARWSLEAGDRATSANS